MALARAGCAVDFVSPPAHPVASTSAVRRTHTYHGLMPLPSFADAIGATRPDLVVPADDLATRHLDDLYCRERRRGRTNSFVCVVIERSLGSPESFSVARARLAFMELAEQEGIRVPENRSDCQYG
jgi:hypothetical protein